MDYFEHVIYAVERDPQDNTLKEKKYPVKLERELTDSQIWGQINFCPFLSAPYQDCLQRIEGGTGKNDEREFAIAFNDTVRKVREKENVVAWSHRYGYRNTFNWKYNKNVEFKVHSLFGFGSVSYLSLGCFYKGIIIESFEYYLEIRNSVISPYSSTSTEYKNKYGRIDYDLWKDLMNDTIRFYNAKKSEIFDWQKEQLDKFFLKFNVLLQEDEFYSILDYGKQTSVTGVDLIKLKAEKIDGSLDFGRYYLRILPKEMEPDRYLKQFHNLLEMFLKIEEKATSKYNKELNILLKREKEIKDTPLMLLYQGLLLYPNHRKFNFLKRYMTEEEMDEAFIDLTAIMMKIDESLGQKKIEEDFIKPMQELLEIKSRQSKINELIELLTKAKKNIDKYFDYIGENNG